MSATAKNYLYDLPEDILVLIYKKAFKETLKDIEDMRETLDNYDRLIAYIKKSQYDPYKTQAIWSITLCYRRDAGDPFYKYFLYYADSETDFLRLNKQKMCRYNPSYSSIKYIEFPIYPLQSNISTESYKSIKKILEEYTLIYLGNYAEKYPNIRGLELGDDKIRIEYASGDSGGGVFKCYIDIYNNILEAYNFIIFIFHILNMYNQLYPAYNLEFMNDLDDLREWVQYNSFFCGFSLNDGDSGDSSDSSVSGDTLSCRFYSARYI
jgi:hypothetical protein